MAVQETIDKYLNEKKKKKDDKTAFDKIRKPTAPPSKSHGDKSKYSRKEKHKKNFD